MGEPLQPAEELAENHNCFYKNNQQIIFDFGAATKRLCKSLKFVMRHPLQKGKNIYAYDYEENQNYNPGGKENFRQSGIDKNDKKPIKRNVRLLRDVNSSEFERIRDFLNECTWLDSASLKNIAENKPTDFENIISPIASIPFHELFIGEIYEEFAETLYNILTEFRSLHDTGHSVRPLLAGASARIGALEVSLKAEEEKRKEAEEERSSSPRNRHI